MAYYIYQVKDDSGRTLHGLMEARDKSELRQKVRSDSYFFISAAACKAEDVFRRKVPSKTLSMFTHRLMSMIEAGISILSATGILWRQSEDPTIQLVVSHIKAQMEEGAQISAAMEAFPNVFPKVYCALIRVGETSGSLVIVLRKLSEYLEFQEKMIERVQRATLYPSFVIFLALAVIIGMFAFVVPTFQRVLVKLNVPLPMLTKGVMACSAVIRSPWFIIGMLFAIVIGVSVFQWCRRDPRFGLAIDRMIFRIPFFGEIFYFFALGNVLRALTILQGAGVPILVSFQLASSTAGNQVIITEMNAVRTQLEHGRSVYEAFRSNKRFPVMLVEMIGIGESSGMLVDVLEKVVKHFDDEVDFQLNRALTIMEPLLIVVVGFIVIMTLMAIYLPIISIWQGLMAR